ncbi:hypothetical protein [Zhongshania sp.]|uniref:hypothetical protein n=1 Tax=Zhongshania sp. TaxID=1971902 RepID=UPI003561A44E
MHIETIQDIIEWSAAFHRSFRTHLQASVATSQDERAKMLSHYIGDHQLNLAKTIDALTPTESANALGTWCTEYFNEQPLPNTAKINPRWAELSADEIFSEVNGSYEQLVDLYRYLLSRCAATPASETLQQLIDIHEHQLKLMAHSVNRLQDI